jgi:tRNA(His) 5'-end guanylyltransferase
MNDAFGNRLKEYEMMEAGRKFLPRLPIVARLDGKGFSKFTKNLARPFDPRLSELMVKTVKFLIQESNANCGYTQSDEITLTWYNENPENQIYFDRRIQKMVSVLAAQCSVYFNKALPVFIPEKASQMPVFDCRIWQMPTLEEATNVFVWRELDACKNSISMAASEYYNHKELEYKTGDEKQEMLFQKGINWNNYPDFFKRGTYVQRKIIKSKLTVNDIEQLPPLHNARKNPDLEIERSEYKALELPPLLKITNRIRVIYFGEDPILAE